jgi:hypothetical protein
MAFGPLDFAGSVPPPVGSNPKDRQMTGDVVNQARLSDELATPPVRIGTRRDALCPKGNLICLKGKSKAPARRQH